MMCAYCKKTKENNLHVCKEMPREERRYIRGNFYDKIIKELRYEHEIMGRQTKNAESEEDES